MSIKRKQISSVEIEEYDDLQDIFEDEGLTDKLTLYINKIIVLSQNTTQPVNFDLIFIGVGCIATNGFIYTCNGSHNHKDSQIWDTALGGSVVYGSTSQMAYISSIWFGTRTGANVALACTAGGGRKVVLSGGTFALDTVGEDFLSVPIDVMPGCYMIISTGCAPEGLAIYGDPAYQIIDSALADVPFIVNKDKISTQWFGSVDQNVVDTGFDSAPAINKTNRSAYLFATSSADGNICQTVSVPVGKYYVGNTSIKLYQFHNFHGAGNYKTTFVKMAGTTGAVIECEQTERIDAYVVGCSYGDFRVMGIGVNYNRWVPSTYRGVDTTNYGIVFNWYRGADQVTIKNILISFCGGNGLRIVEGAGVTDVQFVTMQHSVIENVKLTYCNNGAYVKGFVTDNAWIKCVFDPTDYDSGNVRAFELDYFSTKRMPWDNTFYSCSIQHADIGFHCDYIAWNVKFIGCHFEYNEVAHNYIAGAGTKTIDWDSCTFQLSRCAILVDSSCGTDSRLNVNTCRWWVWNDSDPDNRFIKDLSGGPEIYVGPGQYVHFDTGMTQHVEVPVGTQKIHGYVNPITLKMDVRVEMLQADRQVDIYLDPDVAVPTLSPYYDSVTTTQKLTLASSTGTFSNYETITGGTSGNTATVVSRPSSTVYWIVDSVGSFSAGETITGAVSGVTGVYSSLSSTPIINFDGGYAGQTIAVLVRGSQVSTSGNLKLNGHCYGTRGSLVLRRDAFANWQEISRKEGGARQSFTVVSDAVTIDYSFCTIGQTYINTTNATTINLSNGFSSGKIYYLQILIGGSTPSAITWVNLNTGGTIVWDASRGGAPNTLTANTTTIFTFHKIGEDFYEVSRTSINGGIGQYGVTPPASKPAGASQAVVTLGNTDNEIGGLTISATYDQTEVQALRDKCEELADDVRALSALVHAMRTVLVDNGSMKGSS